MNPRDPLTLRVPRTAREAKRDPYDWWEGPREPEHCIIGFGGSMRPRRLSTRSSRRSPARLLRRMVRALAAWLYAPSPWGRP